MIPAKDHSLIKYECIRAFIISHVIHQAKINIYTL